MTIGRDAARALAELAVRTTTKRKKKNRSRAVPRLPRVAPAAESQAARATTTMMTTTIESAVPASKTYSRAWNLAFQALRVAATREPCNSPALVLQPTD